MIFIINYLRSMLLAAGLVSIALAGPAVGNVSDSADPLILVIGDSLSAAYNMQTREAWPSLLQARLKQDGYHWRVFNSSITGDTTEGGLTRLPRLLERYKPRLVIIELGGNDGLRGLPLEVTESNIARMVELSQAQGARVILAGIRIPPNYGAEYVERFEGIYPSVSEQYDTGLVPFFMEGVAVTPGMMQPDGIHPSVEAQPVLLDNLWPALEQELAVNEEEPGE